MKVAFSATGTSIDDQVDERFGRARYFLMVDTDTDSVEVIDNSENRNALQGAGIASAELIADAGARFIVTGHLGPKAFPALEMAGITGYSGAGLTVRDAFEAFEAGTLAELTEAGEAHSH